MIKKCFKDFLSLVYPNVCLHCDTPLIDGEQQICLRCFKGFPLANYHINESNPLVQMAIDVPKLKGGFCFMHFNKKGIAQSMLHELKYHGNEQIGMLLGQWFARHIAEEIRAAAVDLIVPIPLHKKRLKTRGFNQSAKIAFGMQSILKMPVAENALIRTKNSFTQTKRDKIGRWHNAEEMYDIREHQLLKGRKVLLVDDVVTTGATIRSAAEVLARGDVDEIYLGCIASGKS